MTTSNLTKHFRLIAMIDSHHKNKPTSYVNIRVTSRTDKNKYVDIGVYYENGVRMKVIPDSFKEGTVRKGFYDEVEMMLINDRITKIFQKVKEFVFPLSVVTKEQIENHVYGKHFIAQHKKARTKQLTLSTSKLIPSKYFIDLRKKYPKRKETIITSSINDEGFEIDEHEEKIIDPLNLDDPDFPKNFPKELYNKLKEEYLNKSKSKSPHEWHVEQWVKFHCQLNFYSSTGKETVVIQPTVLESFKKQEGRTFGHDRVKHKFVVNGVTVNENDSTALKQLKKEFEFKNYSTEKIYTQGMFDKTNILHLFGSVYYDTLENQQNRRVVIRLFDYVANTGASTKVKDFNVNWANNFFEWIKKNGYIDISAKMFDTLKHDKSIFINKERKKYKDAGLKKQIVSFTVVSKHLEAKGLPAINYEKLMKVSVQDGQRNTHYLLLNEFETLFDYDFKESKLKDYQSIFDDLKKCGVIKGTFKNDVTVENLKRYRDLFAMQIMIGGLRGLDEYYSVEIIDYDKTGKVFRFLQEKTEAGKEHIRHVLNPLNKYTSELLKRNNNKLPRAKSAEVLNGYLKLIGYIAGLNREFEKGMSIRDNISQYWARKSFGNILFSEGVSEDQIALFTGHETRKSELGRSYLDLQNVNLKRKIYHSIMF